MNIFLLSYQVFLSYFSLTIFGKNQVILFSLIYTSAYLILNSKVFTVITLSNLIKHLGYTVCIITILEVLNLIS